MKLLMATDKVQAKYAACFVTRFCYVAKCGWLVLISVRWGRSHSWPWISAADDWDSWKSTSGQTDTAVFSYTDQVWDKRCDCAVTVCFTICKIIHCVRFHLFGSKLSNIIIVNIANSDSGSHEATFLWVHVSRVLSVERRLWSAS